MPFYEYVCGQCGHTFEQLQRFSDAPLTDCPACHQASLHKKISAPAFHLKGQGWYVTDFKDKPQTAKPAKETTTTVTVDKPSGDASAKTTTDKPAEVKANTDTKKPVEGDKS